MNALDYLENIKKLNIELETKLKNIPNYDNSEDYLYLVTDIINIITQLHDLGLELSDYLNESNVKIDDSLKALLLSDETIKKLGE